VKEGFSVPRLEDSLHRVCFEAQMSEEASQALRSGLQQLNNDHQSGAHELTTIALTRYRDVLVHLRWDPNWWWAARMAAWHMWKNGRESMGAATLNAFIAVLTDMEEVAGSSFENESTWNSALGVVDLHLERRCAMPLRIKESFTAYLRNAFSSTPEPQSTLTILTLSASSTIRDSILDAFASLPFSNLDLRILESRPLFEGASMASSLVSEFKTKFSAQPDRHLKVAVYTDASAAIAADGVDFVLLGADRISSEGWVSNKTGSLPAVLSAKYASPKVKVLVFSQLEKVTGLEPEEDPQIEENQPGELMSSWVSSGANGVKILEDHMSTDPDKSNCVVTVKNIYFEWVPADLIDAYICEEGTLKQNSIIEKAKEAKRKAGKYLGSL
jgi:translation initiation factor 2B subunit (eIF-2B alpha/beta/delta family)